jgi:antitoxin (DNA-binding transcriptional repressor) of toxin-antitoxin stability system
MRQVTVHEAEVHLSRLIQEVLAGEDVFITQQDLPVVKLVAVTEQRQPRRIGGAEGVILFMADDFDAPLGDFAESMP